MNPLEYLAVGVLMTILAFLVGCSSVSPQRGSPEAVAPRKETGSSERRSPRRNNPPAPAFESLPNLLKLKWNKRK